MKAGLRFCAALLAIGSVVGTTAAAETLNPVPVVQENVWRGSLTPYLWLTNVGGAVNYGDTTIGKVNLDAGTLLSHLNFAAMIEGEVHYGRWGLMMDAVYSELSNNQSRATARGRQLDSSTTLKMGIYDIAATYTLYSSSDLYLDGLVGARVFTQDASTNVSATGLLPSGLSENKSMTLTDAIVGVKGRVRLGDSDWFIPYYVDIGAGSSQTNVTSQAYLGVGKSFSWGDLSLIAKNVYYQMKQQGVTTDLDLYGVALAATFRF